MHRVVFLGDGCNCAGVREFAQNLLNVQPLIIRLTIEINLYSGVNSKISVAVEWNHQSKKWITRVPNDQEIASVLEVMFPSIRDWILRPALGDPALEDTGTPVRQERNWEFGSNDAAFVRQYEQSRREAREAREAMRASAEVDNVRPDPMFDPARYVQKEINRRVAQEIAKHRAKLVEDVSAPPEPPKPRKIDRSLLEENNS